AICGHCAASRGAVREPLSPGAWRAPGLPAARRGMARRRNPEGGGPIPFSGSKASPRFWSVSRSMGSDHERPSVKVLPLSVLGTGLLLWFVFRGKRETDERLEAVRSGQIDWSAAAVRELTKVCWYSPG
uniref:Uncharacterized protein n=1 Tax=Taeniopygia guttata TaxID=59729 RepID=A0A674GT37_TAEGU